MREFRRPAKPAVRKVVRPLQPGRGRFQQFQTQLSRGFQGRDVLQMFGQSGSLLNGLFPPVRPGVRHGLQHLVKPRHAARGRWRPVSSPEERLQVGRQKNRHGPAAVPCHDLHGIHVDLIQIRPFLAVHLDRDKVFVQKAGRVPRSRNSPAPSHGTNGRRNSRWKGRSARSCSLAAASASGPQGYQSTGLCACCNR